MTLPDRNTFETAYAGQAAWDIGRPQKAFRDVADKISGSVLDAGCGTGDNAMFFAGRGCTVTGIDCLEEPIWRAKRKAADRNLSVATAVALTVVALCWVQPAAPATQGPPSARSTFLDEFHTKDPDILIRHVKIASAAGEVSGYLARQDKPEALPAVILLHDERGLSPWMKDNARDLASIGFVVLALNLESHVPAQGKSLDPGQVLDDAPLLAKLSAAVRWLRRQSDVLPGRIGVVGWSCGGSQALALAATTPLQACVFCYCPLSTRADLLAGLHGVALMGIFPGKDAASNSFQKALAKTHIPYQERTYPGTRSGFMTPTLVGAYAFEPAEKAWFEIYEFLGKSVEDAQEKSHAKSGDLSPVTGTTAATIADVMRAVNDARGLRGNLMDALTARPADDKAWSRVRSQAVVLAEANRLLEMQIPPRGSRAHWLEEVRAYTTLVEKVVNAADQHNYDAARENLTSLSARCSVCHKQHR